MDHALNMTMSSDAFASYTYVAPAHGTWPGKRPALKFMLAIMVPAVPLRVPQFPHLIANMR